MLRKYFIFSVGLAVITISSLIPITAQREDVQPNANSPRQEQSRKPDSQPDSPKTVIPPPTTEEVPFPPPQPPNTKKQASDLDNWAMEWFRPQTLTQVGLVIAAIWAGSLALDSLRAIRRQTRQTDRHFRLVNQQWLDVSVVTCEVLFAYPKHTSWVIRFKLTNNTALPMTIDQIDCYADSFATMLWPRKTIAPKGHKRMSFGLPLSATSVALYKDMQSIPLSIAGRIHFIDAFKKKQTQDFAKIGASDPQTRRIKRRDRMVNEPGSVSELIAKLEAATESDFKDETQS